MDMQASNVEKTNQQKWAQPTWTPNQRFYFDGEREKEDPTKINVPQEQYHVCVNPHITSTTTTATATGTDTLMKC